MSRIRLVSALVFMAFCTCLVGQESTSSKLNFSIHPQPIPKLQNRHRLLPAESELRDGNAAVVMLRSIWEQQAFMQNVASQISQRMKLPPDSPEIREFPFQSFRREYGRAAYMRTANWYYPFGQQPHVEILLPDVQGLRVLVGQGLYVWSGKQIAEGDLEGARETLLVQLACARHLARTPILVNQLVANHIACLALDRLELLIQQPDSPNLYGALCMLPDELVDHRHAIQWESKALQHSLPSLTHPYPEVGDERWQKIADEFSNILEMSMEQQLTLTEQGVLMVKLDIAARAELVADGLFTEDEVEKMTHQETISRWGLRQTDLVYGKIETAFSLSPPLAIEKLLRVEKQIRELKTRFDAPALPFPEHPLNDYLALNHFQRRIAMLEVVEAIRDYVATGDGNLPERLSRVQHVALANDPLTGRPFEYEIVGQRAMITTPRIPRVSDTQNSGVYRQYVIEISSAD